MRKSTITAAVLLVVLVAGSYGLYTYWDEVGPIIQDFIDAILDYESDPVSECGDGICEGDETHENCPEDCASTNYCGNGACDTGETMNNCPRDCGYYEGLGFEVPFEAVSVGNTFSVDIYLNPSGEEVSFWKISISFDANKLEVADILDGDTLWLIDDGTIDNSAGTVTYIQAWTMDAYPTTTTDLCTVRFKALQTGSASLDFTYQKIGGSDPSNVITVGENANTVTIN